MSRDILILCERKESGIHPVAFELINKALEIAEKTGDQINCLVLSDTEPETEELCRRGSDCVYIMTDESFESPSERLYSRNIAQFIRETQPSIVLTGATNFGRSLAPRVAAELETGLTADCTDLKIDNEGRLLQIRPAFSDNILASIKTIKNPQMATVRYKEFDEAPVDVTRKIEKKIIPAYFSGDEDVRILEVSPPDEIDITDAEVVIAAGRGLKQAEDFAMLEELAELTGGMVGVSRALVDASMAPSSIQIGYSGNRVKPKVYIACGISGAPQHIAGMKEADYIIAINTDASAPIFNIADVGIVGDMYNVIPAMIDSIKEGLECQG